MSRPGRILRLVGAWVLVNGLLIAPGWMLARGVGAVPGANGPGPSWIALEAALLVGLLGLLPERRWSRALAAAAAVAVVLVTLVAVADVAARQSLARPLNLFLDLYLARSIWHLLSGMVGGWAAAAALAGAGVALALVGWGLARLLAPDGSRGWEALPRRLAGVALVALFAAGFAGERIPALAARSSLPAVRLAREQAGQLRVTLAERGRFAAELAAAPDSYATLPGLLSRLEERDVLLAFVESYGMSALDDPRYAPVIRPRLDELARRMDAAGLHLATGALLSPTQGGQSWYAHGTMLSGLWLDNQLRYDLLIASDRETLVDDFERAGHRTVALMPAIQLAWPEGVRFGYDRIFANDDIGYAGPPLNWVTMPDQFTWSFLEHTIRAAASDPRPLFAELGLISSHAPWTPILPVLDDWEGIGDGAVFAPWENAGERPEDLWLDSDRVREHYALSVDYAIAAMIGYAERYVDERTLLIVLGDHQPAPLITGEAAPRSVPVHVIARDPRLLRPFLDWGFRPGALPDAGRPAPRMDEFRDWFVRAYSDPDARGGLARSAGS